MSPRRPPVATEPNETGRAGIPGRSDRQITWVVPLPFDAPPLRDNDRHHWRAKAELIANIRVLAHYETRGKRVPRLDRAVITLHWVPSTKRRRDALSIAPTLKAAVDGVVDAGVLVDDDIAHCEPRCKIHEPDATEFMARVWLTITELTAVSNFRMDTVFEGGCDYPPLGSYGRDDAELRKADARKAALYVCGRLPKDHARTVLQALGLIDYERVEVRRDITGRRKASA